MNKKSKKAIVYFLLAHKKIFVTLILIGLVVGVLEGLSLASFVPIMNQLTGVDSADREGMSTVVKAIYEYISILPIDNQFVAACLLFLFLTLTKVFISILYEFMAAKTGGDILHFYRMELIENYKRAPLSYFEKRRPGEVIYNLTNSPNKVSRLLYFIPRIFIDQVRLVFLIIMLAMLEPIITLTLLVIALFLYKLSGWVLHNRSYIYAKKLYESEQNMTEIATEWIKSIRQIRVAGGEEHWTRGYERGSLISRLFIIRNFFLLASPRHVIEGVVFLLFIIAIIFVNLYQTEAFEQHISVIGLFALAIVRILPSVSTLIRAPLDIRNILPSVEYLYDHINSKDKVFKETADRKEHFTGLKNSISLNHVSMEFPGRGFVLRDINIKISKGDVIAIVGGSGSGKSTLLNTIMGIDAPTSGEVLYDDCNVEKINRTDLNNKVSYVVQDPVIFHGTIKDNITFFNKEYSEESIQQAVHISDIEDFIESLSDRYNTVTGENGVNLSGGQAQRLAISRALITGPDILILDEATSALDAHTENNIVCSLHESSDDRTVIIATHKLRSIKAVDRIYVLDEGRIIEEGTWDELLGDNESMFHALCRAQHII